MGRATGNRTGGIDIVKQSSDRLFRDDESRVGERENIEVGRNQRRKGVGSGPKG